MAGLSCAQALAEAGLEVRVFDKGRGPGGRMSTRRTEPWHFDHGTQYFTARDPAFQEQVMAWQSADTVESWTGRLVELRNGASHPIEDGQVRYVGTPRMNSMLRFVARNLELNLGLRVVSPIREDRGWRLIEISGSELGLFQRVAVAVPAPQAVELLTPVPRLAGQAAEADMTPCWSIMLAFAEPLDLPFDGAFVKDSSLAWVARNNSKPGRPAAESWVLQATQDWSKQHLEGAGEQIAAALLTELSEVLNGKKLAPFARTTHRWRFAAVEKPIGRPCLYDAELQIGACGDWCLEGRVEAAWLSGRALAEHILASA